MDSSSTDFELIESFRAGNITAFNILAERYQGKIYWHARRMTGDHDDADDIMQEVLLVIYRKVKDFRFESALSKWIYRITQTRSLNLLTRKKVKKFFSLDDEENPLQIQAPENLAANFEMKEKLQKLDSVLKELPPKQKEVFILRNFEQLSYEEIAKITGKSVGALKANYFHAIDKVKKLMQEENE